MSNSEQEFSGDSLSGYRGRWVARIGGQVIAQGGTPEQARRAAQASRPREKAEVLYVPASNPLKLPEILEKIASILPGEQKVYLVGGAVRDALLGRPLHDLDFALESDAIQLARRMANSLGGAFFVLDEERDAARVILNLPEGQRLFLDFSRLRGPDLESDLRARDFTINAIAIEVSSPHAILDPLGGAVDLRARLLRACSPAAFRDDPLRIFRGVRLAAGFGFHIQPESRQLMRKAVPLLPGVSTERMRDELFKILAGPQPATALRALDILGVFSHLLPELEALKGVEQSPPHTLDVWAHSLSVVQKLEEVLAALQPEYDPDTAGNLTMGLLVGKLGRYRGNLGEHLQHTLNPDRSMRSLLMLAALYHDVAKPLTRSVENSGRVRFLQHEGEGARMIGDVGQRLHLSNAEVSRLGSIVQHHLRPMLLAQSEEMPSRRAIYRFFRDTGPAGVDVCLLSLADVLGTYGATLPTPAWIRHLDVVRALLEAWWENPQESVSPPALLDGREVMAALQLDQGPRIGELLEALREAQATGKVNSRQEALDFLKNLL
jgi:tRNA nucleotidyltransferase/poly(A) polymerase